MSPAWLNAPIGSGRGSLFRVILLQENSAIVLFRKCFPWPRWPLFCRQLEKTNFSTLCALRFFFFNWSSLKMYFYLNSIISWRPFSTMQGAITLYIHYYYTLALQSEIGGENLKLSPHHGSFPCVHIYSLSDTYLMALFSPRPLTDSGELVASIPGLFLFPWKDIKQRHRDREGQERDRP